MSDWNWFGAAFEAIAGAPNGVARLRELVLGLAVQGRLEPQNPEDEPASELLKRIAAEKARLVKAGKLRKSEPLPPIGEEETPFEIPASWSWTRLATAGIISPRNNAADDSEASFVSMTMIPALYGQPISSETRFWKDIKQGFTHFAENDVVLAKITPCFQNGKSAVVRNLINGFGAGTTELHVFRAVAETIEPNYALIYLKSPMFLLEGEPKMTGSAGQKRVPTNYFSQNPFPLPPLAEQKRIVARVDELMALCDALDARQILLKQERAAALKATLNALGAAPSPAEFTAQFARLMANFDTLFESPASVAPLRAAVLNLAVQGRLEPQNAADESASELLKRIAAQKAELIAQKKLRKSEPLPPIDETETPFDLPEGWKWVRLAELITVMDAGWSPACEDGSLNGTSWGVLKTTAVQQMRYWGHEYKRLPSDLEPRPQHEVKAGDLLITRAGPKNRVGVSCLVKATESRLMISDKIIRFHLFDEHLHPDFIILCLNAGVSSDFIEQQKSGMAESQMNISQPKLKLTPLALPPLAEQKRIVARVDELMALCDGLEAQLRAGEVAARALADGAVKRLA